MGGIFSSDVPAVPDVTAETPAQAETPTQAPAIDTSVEPVVDTSTDATEDADALPFTPVKRVCVMCNASASAIAPMDAILRTLIAQDRSTEALTDANHTLILERLFDETYEWIVVCQSEGADGVPVSHLQYTLELFKKTLSDYLYNKGAMSPDDHKHESMLFINAWLAKVLVVPAAGTPSEGAVEDTQLPSAGAPSGGADEDTQLPSALEYILTTGDTTLYQYPIAAFYEHDDAHEITDPDQIDEGVLGTIRADLRRVLFDGTDTTKSFDELDTEEGVRIAPLYYRVYYPEIYLYAECILLLECECDHQWLQDIGYALKRFYRNL